MFTFLLSYVIMNKNHNKLEKLKNYKEFLLWFLSKTRRINNNEQVDK